MKLKLILAIICCILFTNTTTALEYTGFSFDVPAGPSGIGSNETHLYVGANTIREYYINGTPTGLNFTTPQGLFHYGVTINTSHIFSSAYGDDEVYIYYKNGTYTGESFDTNISGNNLPFGITMNDTYFWIVDNSDDEVYLYYINGTYTNISFDTASSGNTDPQGVAYDSEYLWTLDDNGQTVYRYYHNGTYTGYSYSTASSGNTNPQGVTSTSTHLYITDGSSNKVYKYLINNAPTLITPMNTSVNTFDVPPLLHDITFSWDDVGASAYKYQVALDENFVLITNEDTIAENTTLLSLEADDYFWRVFAYNQYTTAYGDASDIWSFTINETDQWGNVTAIAGIVYESTTAGSVAVDGALVNIWNNTWSDSMLVGQNGYYYFDGAKDGTYSVRATKTGYTDSSIELVTVLALNTTTRNILLQSTSGAGQQYVDHYVRFIVKSWYGTLYSGVEVNVYLGDAVIPQYTDDTGTDGSIAFELDENQEYRITFIDVAQNINTERTLYPVKLEYSIIVFGANLIPDDRPSDDILFGCYGQSINLTHGYINVSFNDTSATTTLAELWINDTNMTNLYYFNTTDNDKAWSQVVDGGNSSYIVVFKLDNTVLDEPLVITRTIKFDDTINVNLGLDEGWKYQLIAVIIISVIALLGSALNAEKMAVITVLVGWLMVFFGWLQAGATIPEQITLGLMMLFATLIAFGSVIRKGDER